MAEPNTSSIVVSAAVAGSLATLFPQYALIIGGALAGSLYSLWGAEQMARAMAFRFVARGMLPAAVFSSLGAEWVSRRLGIDVREAFSPVSFLIAVFHRQAIPAAWRALLSILPGRART